MIILRDNDKTNAAIKSLKSRLLICHILQHNVLMVSNIDTMRICPNSMPKLNASKGWTMLSSFPNIDFSKVENPIPWINPKIKIIENWIV